MKYIFPILLFLTLQSGFSQIYKTVGLSYTNGTPTYTPAKSGSWLALDTVTWRYYTYNGSEWISDGDRIQSISGCSAPNYTPTKFQSRLVINNCNLVQGGPKIYHYNGLVWIQVGGGYYPDSVWVDASDSYSSINISDPIKRTGSATAPFIDKGGAVFNVEAYGVLPNGSDMTSQFQALLDTVYNRGGGTVLFGEGAWLIPGQIRFKNNNPPLLTDRPTQPTIIIRGAGGYQGNKTSGTSGGTVIDCRATTSPARFVTRGLGTLVIEDICFYSGSNNSNPFFLTTNTTIKANRCSFIGSKVGALCDEDVFLLGGATASYDNANTDTSAFQGYGTVIENCFFNKIRRAAYFRTFCSAVIFRDNTIWAGSGGECAIEINDFAVGQTCSGNVITGNLFEMPSYTYGVKMNSATGNICRDNSFFDEDYPGITQAAYRMEGDASYNYLEGAVVGTAPLISEASQSAGTNTYSDIRQYKTHFFQGKVLGQRGFFSNQYDNTLTTVQQDGDLTLLRTIGSGNDDYAIMYDTTGTGSDYKNWITFRANPVGVEYTNNTQTWKQEIGSTYHGLKNITSGTTPFRVFNTAPNAAFDIGQTSVSLFGGNAYRLGINGTSGTVGIGVTGVNTANDVSFYSAGTVTGSIFMYDDNFSATGNVYGQIKNNSSGSNAGTQYRAIANSTANGDASYYCQVDGQGASFGIDNSDGNKVKITFGEVGDAAAITAVPATTNIGIGTTSPSSSAQLEVSSTSKGFLPPRMTQAQRNAISGPAAGLTVYCTDCTATDGSTGATQTYNGSTWKNCW